MQKILYEINAAQHIPAKTIAGHTFGAATWIFALVHFCVAMASIFTTQPITFATTSIIATALISASVFVSILMATQAGQDTHTKELLIGSTLAVAFNILFIEISAGLDTATQLNSSIIIGVFDIAIAYLIWEKTNTPAKNYRWLNYASMTIVSLVTGIVIGKIM